MVARGGARSVPPLVGFRKAKKLWKSDRNMLLCRTFSAHRLSSCSRGVVLALLALAPGYLRPRLRRSSLAIFVRASRRSSLATSSAPPALTYSRLKHQ